MLAPLVDEKPADAAAGAIIPPSGRRRNRLASAPAQPARERAGAGGPP